MLFQGLSNFDFDENYYVAGPMSGYDEYNYPAFDKATGELRDSGIKVLSPHEVPWPRGHETMQSAELWTRMMEATNPLLQKSAGIILLKGWPASTGAGIELNFFLQRPKPLVYYYHDFTLTDMNRRAA